MRFCDVPIERRRRQSWCPNFVVMPRAGLTRYQYRRLRRRFGVPADQARSIVYCLVLDGIYSEFEAGTAADDESAEASVSADTPEFVRVMKRTFTYGAGHVTVVPGDPHPVIGGAA